MMNDKKLKVIVLTHGGAERVLELLAALKNVEIGGVFVEPVKEPQRTFRQKIERSIRYDGVWATVSKFGGKLTGRKSAGHADLETAREKQNALEKLTARLELPLHRVEDYHAPEAIELLKSAGADLGIVYGTNIIRESVFGVPRLGSINLHQGLAPFYRGGPTVFWELYNGEKEIGITIHFVAKKVDTGDIVLQKTLPLEYDYARYGLDYERFLDDFRAALHEPSAQMMAEAVALIAAGREKRIKQDIALGKRYRLPTKKEKDALVRILKERYENKRGFEKEGFVRSKDEIDAI